MGELKLPLAFCSNAGAGGQKIRRLLEGREKPKGHMPCPCGSGVPVRSCHPNAWKGLIKMYADLKNSKQIHSKS